MSQQRPRTSCAAPRVVTATPRCRSGDTRAHRPQERQEVAITLVRRAPSLAPRFHIGSSFLDPHPATPHARLLRRWAQLILMPALTPAMQLSGAWNSWIHLDAAITSRPPRPFFLARIQAYLPHFEVALVSSILAGVWLRTLRPLSPGGPESNALHETRHHPASSCNIILHLELYAKKWRTRGIEPRTQYFASVYDVGKTGGPLCSARGERLKLDECTMLIFPEPQFARGIWYDDALVKSRTLGKAAHGRSLSRTSALGMQQDQYPECPLSPDAHRMLSRLITLEFNLADGAPWSSAASEPQAKAAAHTSERSPGTASIDKHQNPIQLRGTDLSTRRMWVRTVRERPRGDQVYGRHRRAPCIAGDEAQKARRRALASVSVHWVTKVTKYIAYGNEVSMEHVYGDGALFIRVTPFGEDVRAVQVGVSPPLHDVVQRPIHLAGHQYHFPLFRFILYYTVPDSIRGEEYNRLEPPLRRTTGVLAYIRQVRFAERVHQVCFHASNAVHDRWMYINLWRVLKLMQDLPPRTPSLWQDTLRSSGTVLIILHPSAGFSGTTVPDSIRGGQYN
ncbi:hypothetical protein FB451DRAFT_1172982 [Mycena latifolia]|nr:hypothetical protein FB451DRAFT_1172982 [Mycena latifolia]